MEKKALLATIAVLSVLVIGIVSAQMDLPRAGAAPTSGMAGMMQGSMMGEMGEMMQGMDMEDMEEMHEAMGEYLKESNAPAELQEMHASCGKMMGR